MRRRIFVISLLLLALSLSGWSGVLAAAFCSHDAAKPSAATEDHDCCLSKLDEKTEHCAAASPSSSMHEAMTTNETHAATLKTERVAKASEIALRQATHLCLHCASHKGLPTTFVVTREPEQKKRAANFAAPQALKPLVPFVVFFAPTLAVRQNSPPVVTARRHLLLGVLVI